MQLKIIAPGEVFMMWLTAHWRACTHVDRALSIFCSASCLLCGGSSLMMFLRMSATVLCILSQAAFNWGFLLKLVCFWCHILSGVLENSSPGIRRHCHVCIWVVWDILITNNWKIILLCAHWFCLWFFLLLLCWKLDWYRLGLWLPFWLG